ncbi:ribosome recycling factor, partial [Pseudoalteromonas aliena]|uniref:ribosome recycling factor n=1 Tax=Pseudoalteromonas aliena TaxID=247523 RepID=UPI003120369A
MSNDIQKDAQARMHKTVAALGSQLSKIRTGRAHAAILDVIMVSYFGADTPLNQVANVTIEDS